MAKRKAGSFGARACRALRVRLLTFGRESLPPSFAASNWIVQRILATPSWADFHEIPLTHPRVSGLHVHNNLRPIPAGPNMSKSNHWCPEQLELFTVPEQLRLL